jgi:O-antigen/teichoic acid export membrane protein
MLHKRIQNLRKDDVFVQLLKGGTTSLIFRFLGILMTYIFTLLIAKWYGPKGVGIFSISYIVIQIASILSKSGSDTAILKFSADLSTKMEWSVLKNTLFKAYILVIPIGMVLCLVVYYRSSYLAGIFNKKDIAGYVAVASFGFIPISLLYVNAEFLRGLKKIALYSFLQSTLPFGLAAILMIYFHATGHNSANYVIISFVVSLYLSLLISLVLVKKTTDTKINWVERSLKNIGSKISWKYFMTVCLSLMVVSTISYMLGWVDTIILGIYKSEDQVGIYNVCIRIAAITMVPLLAINSIAAPQCASAWVTRDVEVLKKVAHKSTKMIFYCSLPVLLVIVIFPTFVLGLFGKGFSGAPVPLLIISFAQFINAISGSVGFLLQMTEQYNQYQIIVLISLVSNTVLSLCLIPKYGLVGAAIGTSSGIILSNILSILYVKKRFGFWMVSTGYLKLLKN